MSPLCRAVRACAYSCRHRETTQAAVTNRNTATPGCAANPVQVAQPVTAVTATIPTKTGLILRSLRRDAAVVMEWAPGVGYECAGRPYRWCEGNVLRRAGGSWWSSRCDP